MGPDALLIYNPEIEYKTLHRCNKFWKRYLHLIEKKILFSYKLPVWMHLHLQTIKNIRQKFKVTLQSNCV